MQAPIRFVALFIAWPFLTCLLTLASLSAQVPYGYLAVAEETPTGESRVCYVDPATGVQTLVRSADNEELVAEEMAVDLLDPTLLHISDGTTALGTVTLQGSRVLSAGSQATGIPGSVSRLLGLGSEVLLSIPDGPAPGLWKISAAGLPVSLLFLPDARDIVVMGDKAYVHSFADSAPSRIDEVDLVTGQIRSLGTDYPTILSLGAFVGDRLLAGTQAGELLSIDRFSGLHSSTGNPRLGAITSIANDPVTGLSYFSTDRNEVYLFGSFSEPVYVAKGTIRDLDVGVHDLASWLFYGDGCSGSGSLTPHFAYVDVPSLGTVFTVALSEGPPDGGAFLVAGFSRQEFADGRTLPFALNELIPLVGSGCMVLTDVEVSAFTALDAIGQGQISIAIPNISSLVGLHVTWQWAALDPGAPGALVSTHGAEAIVR